MSLKGYRLLARRYGGKGSEIDLIMLHGDTVIFVEVKARRQMDEAMTAVTAAKIGFVTRRIAQWRAENPWAQGRVLRADAVFVAPGRWPRRVSNLFDLPIP